MSRRATIRRRRVLRGETLLANVMASQEVHRKYGGVVPELASRAHQQNIVPVVSQALDQAGVRPDQIDAIAYTRGPGLLGSLLVGVSFAKGLSLATGKPLVDVNHLQGHILSHFIRQEGKSYVPPTCSLPGPAGIRRPLSDREGGRPAAL